MRVTVVRPGDLGPGEAELWWSFQQSAAETLNPFMSLTYVQAVDRFRPTARVAVVEDQGQIATALLFGDPTARAIVKELATADGDDCRGVVSVLFAGSRPAAVHLGLLGPRSLAGWFMSYDPSLSRFAPGMMLWNPLAKAARPATTVTRRLSGGPRRAPRDRRRQSRPPEPPGAARAGQGHPCPIASSQRGMP